MLDYEIRYLTNDARLAVLYRTQRNDDREAVRTAMSAGVLRYKLFEVWRGDECVGRGINPSLPN